jgi:hypothetical protein
MGRYDGEIVGVERNQFELFGRRHSEESFNLRVSQSQNRYPLLRDTR